jgi:hypothetical protein
VSTPAIGAVCPDTADLDGRTLRTGTAGPCPVRWLSPGRELGDGAQYHQQPSRLPGPAAMPTGQACRRHSLPGPTVRPARRSRPVTMVLMARRPAGGGVGDQVGAAGQPFRPQRGELRVGCRIPGQTGRRPAPVVGGCARQGSGGSARVPALPHGSRPGLRDYTAWSWWSLMPGVEGPDGPPSLPARMGCGPSAAQPRWEPDWGGADTAVTCKNAGGRDRV